MIDDKMQDLELAVELGFRVVQLGPDNFQYQAVDGKGRTTRVAPSSPHAYALWVKASTTLRQLASEIEGGEAGGDVQPKSPASPAA
jgi:hypothetical protein